MTQPMASHRCIYLDPAKGYRLCNAPVAPGGLLLCLKHRAEAELRYRERQDEPKRLSDALKAAWEAHDEAEWRSKP